MPLNPIVASVSIIRGMRAGTVIGSGTGFFYDRGDNLFLVTNRHVVRDDPSGYVPEMLRLRLHRNAGNITENGDYDVPFICSRSAGLEDISTASYF